MDAVHNVHSVFFAAALPVESEKHLQHPDSNAVRVFFVGQRYDIIVQICHIFVRAATI